MKRTTRIAAAIGAGGALLVGGTAAVTAAIVDGTNDRPVQAQVAGGYGPMRQGQVQGQAQGQRPHAMGGPTRDGMGMGRQGGAGQQIAITAPSGTLTQQQKTELAYMAEEEKMAQDLYAAFAARYNQRIFTNISNAETKHLTAVRTVLSRYGLADPTSGKAAGVFSNTTLQQTYDRLLAQGNTSQEGALKAGKTVEETDIADLKKSLGGLSAPDVKQVYEHLLAGSQNHLTAFDRWLG